MKRLLILVFALTLTAGLAWAEEPAATAADDAVTPDEPLFQESGCELPDLDGVPEGEVEAVLAKAGFDVQQAQAAAVPACPVRFDCNSITNCGKGSLCSVTDIGPCCSRSGLTLCCISGSIKVTRCPCRCTSTLCALSCVNSTDVKWRCN